MAVSASIDSNHWSRYAPRWSQVKAPLRVNEAIVHAFREVLAPVPPGPALLLGMTPELLPLFEDLDVVDRNPAMLQALWQGRHPGHRAHAMDWLAFAGRPLGCAVVAGDGSLNNADSPVHLQALIQHVNTLMAPGGWFACRLFERPSEPFTLDDLVEATNGRREVNFHAFKWMMAMHLAHRHGMQVPVARIHELFQLLCPDMAAVSLQTGWPVDEIRTIEIYAGSSISYVFPSRAEILSLLPSGVAPRFVGSGAYDLSACCPIVLFQKPVT